ncbi:MAG: hypothetical protein ACREM6_01335 [Vulcanimicrobiaceae bacterium]
MPASASVLPAGSVVQLVLDSPISSVETGGGAIVRFHLRDPIVLNGREIVPVGAVGRLDVIAVRKASASQAGSVRIYLEPLILPMIGVLPLQAVNPTIRPIGRTGQNVALAVGAAIEARTSATIDAADPQHVRILEPVPYVLGTDPVHTEFTPIPFFTIPPIAVPSPQPTPTAKQSPPATRSTSNP